MLHPKGIFNMLKLIRYNLKIVFGGKFLLFIFVAFAFFLIFGTITALNDQNVEIEDVYGLLTLPAILLVFYPAVFGIQREADSRTLEIIFGIPDYRFKVWLLRLVLVIFISFILLFPFAFLAHLMLISIPILSIVIQLTVLIVFIGTLAFCLSTIIKSGTGTAAVIIIAVLIFFILYDSLKNSMWNIFLNPFANPSNMNEVLWSELVFKNRIFLISSSLIFVFFGLLNLQNREKFIR